MIVLVLFYFISFFLNSDLVVPVLWNLEVLVSMNGIIQMRNTSTLQLQMSVSFTALNCNTGWLI
jgi:hypothetical protein